MSAISSKLEQESARRAEPRKVRWALALTRRALRAYPSVIPGEEDRLVAIGNEAAPGWYAQITLAHIVQYPKLWGLDDDGGLKFGPGIHTSRTQEMKSLIPEGFVRADLNMLDNMLYFAWNGLTPQDIEVKPVVFSRREVVFNWRESRWCLASEVSFDTFDTLVDDLLIPLRGKLDVAVADTSLTEGQRLKTCEAREAADTFLALVGVLGNLDPKDTV